MQVHRTAHERDFTIVPNQITRNNRLTFGARGLLTHLIGRADGTRIDIRILAEENPEGRQGVANLLNELKAEGYYRVVHHRTDAGRIISEVHVYDTPQTAAADASPADPPQPPGPPGPPGPPQPVETVEPVEPPQPVEPVEPPRPVEAVEPADPQPVPPGSGAARSRDAGAPLRGKNQGVKPSLPWPPANEPQSEAGRLLHRVVGRHPRLRLGEPEVARLAPMVETWLERGATEVDLRHALLDGLPTRIMSAAGLLANRLARKLPPAPDVVPPPTRHDCTRCERPGLPAPGICRSCAGLPGTSPPPSRPLLGPALARAALHGRMAVP